jgi:hypothetical protein
VINSISGATTLVVGVLAPDAALVLHEIRELQKSTENSKRIIDRSGGLQEPRERNSAYRNEKNAVLLSQGLHPVALVDGDIVVLQQKTAEVSAAQHAAGTNAVEQELGLQRLLSESPILHSAKMNVRRTSTCSSRQESGPSKS